MAILLLFLHVRFSLLSCLVSVNTRGCTAGLGRRGGPTWVDRVEWHLHGISHFPPTYACAAFYMAINISTSNCRLAVGGLEMCHVGHISPASSEFLHLEPV